MVIRRGSLLAARDDKKLKTQTHEDIFSKSKEIIE